LAGERRGLKPEGFDLGNSPLEFSSEEVGGKQIVLTTTSGTRAVSKAKEAKWVLIGAFLNSEAVADAALKLAKKEHVGVSFVLAGKRGRFSLEDFLCAGAISNYFPTVGAKFSDGASAAVLAFQQARNSLEGAVQQGGHAQYLQRLGLREDVKFCSKMNSFSVVPVLEGGKIIPLDLTRF
jgi:2-phosphosulfolactate phosphatase